MTFTTVGEIIDALSQYNRATPIVRSDNVYPGYFNIDIVNGLMFRIKPAIIKGLDDDEIAGYKDCPPADADGFDAVVL